MTFRLVLYNKVITFLASELLRARLLGVEMIKSRLTRNNLSVLGYL